MRFNTGRDVAHGNNKMKGHHGSGHHSSGHHGNTHPHIGISNRSTSGASPRGSIFSNFETVRLSTDERMYLHAARLGNSAILNTMLREVTEGSTKLNVNCVDYMGRNALHLAVDSENVDAIEILLERVAAENMEESLLHAISLGALNVVRLIVDHPRYLCKETQNKLRNAKDAFFRTEEKYQYPPDITPLILAAHNNDHEMIQMFLARGNVVERPHAIHCPCDDCIVKQQSDSLKRSRSRLNAYKALSSPAYMALSSPDPITTTFMLRQEMMMVASVEKEFQSDYIGLAEQCMDFACEMMDLCRGTQEVEAVLGEESHDQLARLSDAINYVEKKFVAHPNCQQHLTSIWYGKEMGFLQSTHWLKKLGLILLTVPLLPFLCVAFMVNPNTKVAKAMRCPVSKFVVHTVSHFMFLILLGVATFGLGEVIHKTAEQDLLPTHLCHNGLESTLRPARNTITKPQILIIFWIIGLIWIECKQVYSSGAREHFLQYYNYMDFSLLALYLASYALRFVALRRVMQSDDHFDGATIRIKAECNSDNPSETEIRRIIKGFEEDPEYGYFMKASRFDWRPEDPEIISDILFAVANILSFARTTYVMPSHELLGPLQISLGRMLGDIAKFVVLFLLVLVAFMVGMTNLYQYYGSHKNDRADTKTASDSFKGFFQTVYTLFFSIFGLIPLDNLKIKNPVNDTYISDTSSELVDRMGLVLFAIYQIAVTIVLVNMLIAMMSHSFEDIQGDNDVEWKFARTQLWMNYIDGGSTLPVPFNMIPSLKSLRYAFNFVKKNVLAHRDEAKTAGMYDRTRRRGLLPSDLDPFSQTLVKNRATYSDIIQRLVRRYLFKLDRMKRDQEKVETVAHAEDYQDEDLLVDCKTLSEEEEDIEEAVRKVSETSDLIAIDEDSEIDIEKPLVAKRSAPLGATPMPRTPPSLPRDSPVDDMRRSTSNEALRQMTRRATTKRSGKRSTSAYVPKVQSSVQLDAIQRGQRMLDARLQDLQSITRNEDITANLSHVRKLLTESQKALGSLVTVMSSMQEDVHGMTRVLNTVHNKVNDRARGGKNILEVKGKERVTHTKSDDGSSCTTVALPPQPVMVHVQQSGVKGHRNKRWHSIKKSLKRKKGGSSSDDNNPV